MYKRNYVRVDIDKIIEYLSGRYRLSQDVMRLVEMDLCSGMTKEEVLKYCTKNISVGRMKIISDCIRNGCDDEVIKKLSAKERSDEVLETVFELLDKGVSITAFEDNLENRDRLLELLNEYTEKISEPGEIKKEETEGEEVEKEGEISKGENDAEDKIEEDNTENKIFISEKENIVNESNESFIEKNPASGEGSKSGIDEEKQLVSGSEELKAIFSAFRDEIMAGVSSVIDKSSSSETILLKEYTDKLSEATEKLKEKDEKIAELVRQKEQMERVEYVDVATYEKLKQDLKNMEEMMHKNDHILEQWMKENEERFNLAVAEIKKEKEVQMEENKEETLDLSNNDDHQNIMEGRTLEVTDSNGKVISSLPVEHTNKKTSALGGIAAALGMKKRSRRSMMQMAISGELSKEQLIQIVTAIKCGLSETQLCNLIENKVPAERMPQIIEIARLENEMGYNG